jgi:hypothetical protein
MHRLRATLAFVFFGGLLIFNSPYVIREAYNKHLPWSVPLIVIPLYALLSYGAFKRFWPHIIGARKAAQQNKNLDEPQSKDEPQPGQ